jgi:hypothetical protein
VFPLILRLWARILRPCLDVCFIDEAAAEDDGPHIALIASRPIGLRITGHQK